MAMSTGGARTVLIAGGGIAALEALLALRALTDGDIELTLLNPEPEFLYRPMLVVEPFSPELAERRDLAMIAAEQRATFVADSLAAVDPAERIATTGDGDRLPFRFAVIATGARMAVPLQGVHTLWTGQMPVPIDVILERAAERGGLELIVPDGITWSLPLYEYALLAGRRLMERGEHTPIRIFTPEPEPLAVFGATASEAVREVLARRRIEVVAGGHVARDERGELRAGAVELTGYPIALPVMEGRAHSGLPADERGFLPIDGHARVIGTDAIYAAGDGTNFPIKQGGIATQQADAAAEAIAAALGEPIEPQPFDPVLRGRLLTDHDPINMLHTDPGGSAPGEAGADALWWPPHKVSGRHLAPWMAGGAAGDPHPPERSIEVEVGMPYEWHGAPHLRPADGRFGD